MAVKKKDPPSPQGRNDKASVQQARASAQYRPGEAVNQAASALEQWQSSRPAGYQSQYQGQINSLLDQAMNQEKFSYDYASDPLYRQYAQAYRQNAHAASTHPAATAAAPTRGDGSSAAPPPPRRGEKWPPAMRWKVNRTAHRSRTPSLASTPPKPPCMHSR